MKNGQIIIVISLLLTSINASAQLPKQSVHVVKAQKMKLEDQEKQLERGIDLLLLGQQQAAIDRHFSKIIAFFSKTFPASKGKFYTARSREEMIIYLTIASIENKNRDAFVVSNAWSEAYYNTGYALIELNDWQQAKHALEQALELAPQNAKYLAELAYVYQLEKNWQKALKLYEKAESDADISPPESQSQELRRAKRGIGFILIELRQFAAARKKYYECLAIDKNDKNARHELNYIDTLLKSSSKPEAVLLH